MHFRIGVGIPFVSCRNQFCSSLVNDNSHHTVVKEKSKVQVWIGNKQWNWLLRNLTAVINQHITIIWDHNYLGMSKNHPKGILFLIIWKYPYKLCPLKPFKKNSHLMQIWTKEKRTSNFEFISKKYCPSTKYYSGQKCYQHTNIFIVTLLCPKNIYHIYIQPFQSLKPSTGWLTTIKKLKPIQITRLKTVIKTKKH